MYIILNNTKDTVRLIDGDFPALEYALDNGDDMIVISTYSNTIKIPFKDENGDWDCKDFTLPVEVLKLIFNSKKE
jgi:hypothetical protein